MDMQNHSMEGHGPDCKCSMCTMKHEGDGCGYGHKCMFCYHHKSMLLRILVILAIVFFAFWLGIKVGEFRGYGMMSYSVPAYGRGRPNTMMQDYYCYPQQRQEGVFGPGMMNQY